MKKKKLHYIKPKIKVAKIKLSHFLVPKRLQYNDEILLSMLIS